MVDDGIGQRPAFGSAAAFPPPAMHATAGAAMSGGCSVRSRLASCTAQKPPTTTSLSAPPATEGELRAVEQWLSTLR